MTITVKEISRSTLATAAAASDVVVLDAAQDPHRGDLGLEGQVPGQQHERAVLADAPRERQRRAGGDGGDRGSGARSAGRW